MSQLCEFERLSDEPRARWKCATCEHVTEIAFGAAPVRECVGKIQVAALTDLPAYHTCPHRGQPVASVSARVAGVGCSSTTLTFYHCRQFREPVLKYCAAWANDRNRDRLLAAAPDYTGRTCSTCLIHEQPRSSPAVAVVVTCHNYGRYLCQCLESILVQTHWLAAIILVDDASDDDTPAIAAAYSPRGVRYLRTKYRDVALARNAGAALAGKPAYLLFVDADNYLQANYVERLLTGMTGQSVGVTYAGLSQFTDDGRELGLSRAIQPFSLDALRKANLADTCSLIRRQAFEQAGGWRTYRWGLHDWDLWLRITAAGWTMQLVDGTALRYRVHPASMSAHRHGQYQSGMHVMQDSQLTTIVTLFSGRAWMLDRWFAALAAVRWPAANLHLVAIDNSRDPVFAAELQRRLTAGSIRYTYLRDDRRIVESQSSAAFADLASQRIANNYAMNIHMARLYAGATQYLPAATGLVWSVEDDVEFPPDALEQLATEMFRTQAGAVAACLRNRFADRGLLAWIGHQRITAPPPTSQIVDASGFYCLLARRDAWASIAWRAGATGTDQWPYYDWAACHDLRAAGHTIRLLGTVRCRHWQADGTAWDV